MESTKELLEHIEYGGEENQINSIKQRYHLRSERNARVLLHILENDPQRYPEKLQKEVFKLENKLYKEQKRLIKKQESYLSQFSGNHQRKLQELKAELEELRQVTI